MLCSKAACLAVFAMFLAYGCASDVPESLASHSDLASASSDGARPVAPNWKDEQKRLALLGLSYETGIVTVVAEDAAARVSGPDAQAAENAFALGAERLASNDVLGAISAYTEAVLLAPDSPEMLAGLGDALLVKRMVHRAAAAYRTALQHAPLDGSLQFALADTQWRIGERDLALATAREATRLDPTLGRAHARLAVWTFYANEYSEAWSAVHRAEALGETVPAQFRVLLANAMPEPQ
jgi:tetratricopeptide (TPR) repeat protein